jgi:putative nucleotidyltransferase with HDIG domain
MLPTLESAESPDRPLGESVIPDHHFSEPAATNAALQRAFTGKDDLLASIPSVPAILQTLLSELNQPAESVNLLQVVEIIGRDESLAAQCLRLANSVLFSRGPGTDTLRGAVRMLGLGRIRDIAISCALMRIVPVSTDGLNPLIFWQHSLSCAIIARKLGRSVGFGDPEKAYLAGLMHDIGYVVNLIVVPHETAATLDKAKREARFAGEVEYSELGYTHCQAGEILARQWRLSDGLIEVIRCHHDPSTAKINPALVAIVSLSDKFCRASNLGLGYLESVNPLESWKEDWSLLAEKCPLSADITWSDFVKDSGKYVDEIQNLVSALCKGGQ